MEVIVRLKRLVEADCGRAVPIVRVHHDTSLFPKDRDMAKTKWNTTTITPFELVLRPNFFEQPADRILGVLMHEFGHISMLMKGKRAHSEIEADREAERIFRTKLFYDELHVQTVLPTAIPTRPAYLHQ
jgi:hypothetical protein